MKLPVVAAALLLLAAACSAKPGEPKVAQAEIEAAARGVITYPQALDPACRDGRAKAYDQCSDQMDLFNAALADARAGNKAVLVIIGAEWCSWCHSFDAHLKGATGRFDYVTKSRRGDVSAGALDLVNYVAANYIIAHIEDEYAPGADQVILATDASDYFQGYYPTIYAVGPDGKFAAKLDHPFVKIQKDGIGAYRGYDRALVLQELKRLHKAAMKE